MTNDIKNGFYLDNLSAKNRGRILTWRQLLATNWEFPPSKMAGCDPNFIRCSRTTPSNFSLLYFLVSFKSLIDSRHIINEAATTKHPKTAPMTMNNWQSGPFFKLSVWIILGDFSVFFPDFLSL